ncbi:MAG: hypothetical protein AAGJ82_03180 [Bacteroidota bacterium]
MKTLSSVLNTVRQSSPALYWIGLFNFFVAGIALAGMFIDDRSLMGVSVWLKPFKFGISTGIYILTVGFMSTLYPFSTRKRNVINNIVSWTLFVEILIIATQGARGVQSHYNQSSAFDGILFAIMGLFIGINVLLMVVFLIETIRLKLAVPTSVQWAIGLGWLTILAGSWVGGQMISQVAHNVGVADGGAGLPIVNWSTVAGDLRVAHFFGIHAIQVLPLFAWLLYQKWSTTSRYRTLAVSGFFLLYAGWIAFTFYQAKQGLPLLAVGPNP